MSKFNSGTVRAAARSPITSEDSPSGHTHQGGAGYLRDSRSELFLLAVTNLVGEESFYETAAARDSRFGQLIRAIASKPDPDNWLGRFAAYLRGPGNMRSASLVLAAETVHARLAAGCEGNNRQIINAVLQRPDEPGEFLAYWISNYGRNLPMPVKRGVADAAARLYTERASLKYDTASHTVRFADVIRLAHPAPRAEWQLALFRHLIGNRIGVEGNDIPSSLLMLRDHAALKKLTPAQARKYLLTPNELTGSASDALAAAGMTWEQIPALVDGPWTKELWEAIIPSMGYMALLRNLRNFDQAGVSDEVAATVAAKLSNPEQVSKSRQFPMRFLSAFNAAPSLRWAWPLEKALDLSLTNLPTLRGDTLILIDTSSSMNDAFSKDGALRRWDAAVVFGLALAHRNPKSTVVAYSTKATTFPSLPGESLLSSIQRWKLDGYFLGGGTATAAAAQHYYKKHDRVVILTDEQTGRYYGGGDPSTVIPKDIPLYTFNLAGYEHGHAPSGIPHRHTFGGLTDSMFTMMPLLERGRNTDFPF